jgi:hypothetical protein
MRVVPPLPKRQLRKLRTPTAQIVAAGVVMVGGAYLIAWWMVGIVLMLAGLMLGVDALLRTDDNTARRSLQSAHENILEQYRQAR